MDAGEYGPLDKGEPIGNPVMILVDGRGRYYPQKWVMGGWEYFKKSNERVSFGTLSEARKFLKDIETKVVWRG